MKIDRSIFGSLETLRVAERNVSALEMASATPVPSITVVMTIDATRRTAQRTLRMYP